MPAKTLTRIANTDFAVRFGMDISGDDTEHFARNISAKTWVAMSRNSGQHEA
jgi:hypothetical protein